MSFVEFQIRRRAIFAAETRLKCEEAQHSSLVNKQQILEVELKNARRLCQAQKERIIDLLEDLVYLDLPRVQVFTDMSPNKKEDKIFYGGVLIENGALTTLTGKILPDFPLIYTSALEALALAHVAGWAAENWPGVVLEIYSDCQSAIEVIKEFIQTPSAHKIPPGSAMRMLWKALDQHLGPHRDRLLPLWAPRITPEIQLCDALARRKLGGPLRNVWLCFLTLAQGNVRGYWTPAATQVIHNYHRAIHKGRRSEGILFRQTLE